MIELESVPSLEDRLTYILSAIGAIQEILHEVSESVLANDRMRRMALERFLEIIAVASKHIPAKFKSAENDVDWQAIEDIGDRLQNTHDRIQTHILWTISQDKLLALKICAERYLREPD
jgi:uncharacterized protein with HEPN domain